MKSFGSYELKLNLHSSPQQIESASALSCGEPDTASCGSRYGPYDMLCREGRMLFQLKQHADWASSRTSPCCILGKRYIMAWTDDRVATLTKLWADGLSASQIAKQLGGVTRNAVIGKVHRLGLSGRAKPSSPARKAAARKTAASKSARSSTAAKSKPKPSRAPSAPP